MGDELDDGAGTMEHDPVEPVPRRPVSNIEDLDSRSDSGKGKAPAYGQRAIAVDPSPSDDEEGSDEEW